MKRKKIRALWLALPLLLLAASPSDPPAKAPGKSVVVCPINGTIDDGVLILVQRALREGKDAAAVVFDVNTPGGRVDSAIAITSAILKSDVPTIAYINKGWGAISAGALISYSCNHMLMAPGTNIGAATPVMMSPEGMQPTEEKVVSFVRGKMRTFAEKNGYNPDIAEAMVDADIELKAWRNADGKLIIRATDKGPAVESSGDSKADDQSSTQQKAVEKVVETVDKKVPLPDKVKDAAKGKVKGKGQTPAPVADIPAGEGKIVLPKGKLLTLTSEEAQEWGVIPTICDHLNDALNYYGYTGMTINRISATWSEDLFRWLINPTVTGLLLLLGIGGLYFEVKTPGFGLPGIIGLTCLALFFGSRAVIGLADWIDLVLVALGILLLLVEIFVLPGFGLPGVAGILCVLVGLYLSFTRVPIPQYSWDFRRLHDMGVSMAVFSVGIILLVFITAKLFPKTPMHRRLVLSASQQVNEGYVVQTEDQESMVGATGVATSMLRPAGRGRFNGKTYSVVSRGDYLPPDTPIVVVRVEGNRLVVDPLKEEA